MATTAELKSLIEKVLDEAKKKKEKADQSKVEPSGFSYVEAYDYSQPLGGYNLYKSQGAVNWGPMTGPGTSINDRHLDPKYGNAGKVEVNEAFLRAFVRDVIREAVDFSDSAWRSLAERFSRPVPTNIWEAALVEIDKAKCAKCGGKLDDKFKCVKCSKS